MANMSPLDYRGATWKGSELPISGAYVPSFRKGLAIDGQSRSSCAIRRVLIGLLNGVGNRWSLQPACSRCVPLDLDRSPVVVGCTLPRNAAVFAAGDGRGFSGGAEGRLRGAGEPGRQRPPDRPPQRPGAAPPRRSHGQGLRQLTGYAAICPGGETPG